MTARDDYTQALQDFVANVAADDLPTEVRRESVRGLVNAVGCTIGGARHEMVDVALRAMLEFSGRPVASLFGRGEKVDILLAALINGLAGAAYSFDDTYSDVLLHPNGAIAMAMLALAERSPVAGSDFLTAFAVGAEIACRLTKCLSAPPAEAELAWSQTGIACGAGAAMATGRLLGLDARQLGSALGIAMSQASGTRVAHGSMTASLIFGQAANTGLRAALLAQQGFTSSEGSIEKRYGFASVFAKRANLPALLEGLGTHFELMSNVYKPYPCAVVIHPALEGALVLKRRHQFAADDVERITLHVGQAARTLSFRPDPKDDLEAKMSLQHWVAAAALTGKAGIGEGRPEMVKAPQVAALRQRIDVVPDPDLAQDVARVGVALKDGRHFEEAVDPCIGSVTRPMTDDDLAMKFLDQSAAVVGRERAEQLLAACWQAETATDMGAIARLAC